jgi:hypothetical protein
MTTTVAIVSHERLKKLRHMVYQLENQTEPFDQIKLYVSGYEPEELSWCKYPISYQPDRKDWGHEKRAIAMNECNTDYIVCASDDDIYLYHFLAKMKAKAMETQADIVYCNFRTNAKGDAPYVDSRPQFQYITNGNMIIKTELAKRVPYSYREYGADGRWVDDAIRAGATTAKVEECLFFHY